MLFQQPGPSLFSGWRSLDSILRHGVSMFGYAHILSLACNCYIIAVKHRYVHSMNAYIQHGWSLGLFIFKGLLKKFNLESHPSFSWSSGSSRWKNNRGPFTAFWDLRHWRINTIDQNGDWMLSENSFTHCISPIGDITWDKLQTLHTIFFLLIYTIKRQIPAMEIIWFHFLSLSVSSTFLFSFVFCCFFSNPLPPLYIKEYVCSIMPQTST